MKNFILLIIIMLMSENVLAQQLTGHIVNTEGQPVSNASVYIREISLGLVADDKGEFRTQIGKGGYTVEISSMGFEKKIIFMDIPEKGLDVKIELQDKVYELEEITVTKGSEDPAYRIMRNLIARTPYFYRQVKNYESDIYLKGSFKIDKIPKLMTIGANKKEIDLVVGKLFVLESQNKVKYTQPNKYEQHVIAIKSSIPAELNFKDNAPLSMATLNIYAPDIFGGLLSPSSFSVYKFSLEDSYTENGHTIHKIKIIPKKKSRRLISGYLNVVADTWNIQQANIIENELPGMTANYNLTYNEVKTGAFLPTSYDMSLDINMMGIKGFGKFYCSIQYKQVETNSFMAENDGNQDTKQGKMPMQWTKQTESKNEKSLKNKQKDLKKLEELVGKENLSTREARQMSQLINKTTETEEERQEKRKLEIIPLDSMIYVTVDTLALLRDSSFWEANRKTPLNSDELQSYVIRDSLKITADSIRQADSIADGKVSGWLTSIALGGSRNAGKKVNIHFDGILKACPEYNFTDGFRLGQKMNITANLDDNKSIKFIPSAYYTTARRTVVWKTDALLAYAPLRNGHLFVSTGNTSIDYNTDYGTNRTVNSVASLIFAKNTAKFYQSKFAHASNHIDITNGLGFNAQLHYEHRNELYNNTSFNFLGRTPASNLPYGYTEPVMPPHNTFSTLFSLQYTPRLYYYIRKGRKHNSHSSFPTFLLAYKKAFSRNNPVNPSYERLELSIIQQVKTDIFSSLIYMVNAGAYLSKKTAYLPDYRHFNTNELFITDKFLYNSFVLANNYKYAANTKWMQAHVSYNSDYILLKHIPFLQKYMITEDVHLKTLFLPGVNHSEAGYSTGLGAIGRIGVFVGFDNWKYDKIGIIISLPLLNF